MKRIQRYGLIGTAVLAAVIAATVGFAATETAPTKPIPAATVAEAKIVQNFQNGNLNIQFRYDEEKLRGVRFMNMGTVPMQLQLLGHTYILGPQDYMVINPPNVAHLQIFRAPYVAPLTTVDFLLPNRFGQQDVFTMPTSVSDSISSDSVSK